MLCAVMQNKRGCEPKGAAPALARLHQNQRGGAALTRAERLDQHRAKPAIHGADDLGQAFGLLDQGQVTARLEPPGGGVDPVGERCVFKQGVGAPGIG